MSKVLLPAALVGVDFARGPNIGLGGTPAALDQSQPFPLVRDSETGEILTREEGQPSATDAPAAPSPTLTPPQSGPEFVREEPGANSPAGPSTPAPDPVAIRQAERARVREITDIGARLNIPAEEVTRQIDGDATPNGARTAFARYLEEHREAPRPSQGMGVPSNGLDEIDTMRSAMGEAMLHRLGRLRNDAGQRMDLPERARDFRSSSLLDLARDCLARRGERVRGLSPSEIFEREWGMGTSDLAHVLGSIQRATLQQAYQETSREFEAFTVSRTVPNFNAVKRVQMSAFPDLKLMIEGAEMTQGVLANSAETVSVLTYGRKLVVSREMLINDELGAIERAANGVGAAASRLENTLVFGVLNSNPTMADGNALFSANHGNLAGTAAVVSETSVNAGEIAMAAQKGLTRGDEVGEILNLRPRILLCNAKNKLAAVKLVADTTPNSAADVQVYTDMSVVVSAYVSGTKWYLFESPAVAEVIEVTRLEGAQNGPLVYPEMNTSPLGMSWAVVHDVGAKPIDHRGAYYNAGA